MAWLKHQYEVITTADGSPSLRAFGGESMHHSGGAWAETCYIYGEPLQAAFSQGASRVLSVGLGLGYNEILCSRIAGLELLQSHERDPFLSTQLLLFLDPNTRHQLSPEIQKVYEAVFLFAGQGVGQNELCARLLKLKNKNNWRLLGPIGDEVIQGSNEKFQVILYDAFSAKTNPELWEEDFLTSWLQQVSDSSCLFSSYACTGTLKRSLKTQGFQVYERHGFQGKRSSTLASRGFILCSDSIRGTS